MAKLPSQDAAATAFAEVFTVIDWMVETHGVESVDKLLEAMAKGSTDRKAIEAVTGMSFSKFERAWRRYLGEARLRRLDQAFDTRLLFRGYDTQATELEMIEAEDARRWIWLGDQLQIQRRPLAALKEYEKAAQIVGDAVPMIQAKIGRMHLELGQLQQAKESLEGALSVAPDYVLLPLLLGRIAALEGEHLSARSHLEHALRLNPFDVHLHGALAGTYDALSEEALAARERRAQSSLHDAMRDPGDRP
jgi:tetratricopeptide (TPR) repeat protein